MEEEGNENQPHDLNVINRRGNIKRLVGNKQEMELLKQRQAEIRINHRQIYESQIQELQEPLRKLVQEIEKEEGILETLKSRRRKIKKKLLEIYTYFLARPNMIR